MRAYLLPGLAADERLFGPQMEAFPGTVVPPWIAPLDKETIESYSERLAESLRPIAPCWIGGFSFGGMVALEMVRHLKPRPKGVLLICGVRGRHQLTADFQQRVAVASLVPEQIQKLFYEPFAEQFARGEDLSEANTKILVSMARNCDAKFLRWASQAAANWFAALDLAGVRIVHIHGERDRVIPDVRHQATHTIAGAGHLITMTHPNEVNAILRTLG
jgi:pimeloyl-ACP methyl ester carboxylesterase